MNEMANDRSPGFFDLLTFRCITDIMVALI